VKKNRRIQMKRDREILPSLALKEDTRAEDPQFVRDPQEGDVGVLVMLQGRREKRHHLKMFL
jgi:hypothetical protein